MNRALLLLTLCQGFFLTNNVTFIAINGLVGLALAPSAWMATLPVTAYATRRPAYRKNRIPVPLEPIPSQCHTAGATLTFEVTPGARSTRSFLAGRPLCSAGQVDDET